MAPGSTSSRIRVQTARWFCHDRPAESRRYPAECAAAGASRASHTDRLSVLRCPLRAKADAELTLIRGQVVDGFRQQNGGFVVHAQGFGRGSGIHHIAACGGFVVAGGAAAEPGSAVVDFTGGVVLSGLEATTTARDPPQPINERYRLGYLALR